MNYMPFVWDGKTLLAHELAMPFCEVSVRIEATHGRPISLTLLRCNRPSIRIQSQMYDVGKRLEIGVLKFDLVKSSYPDERIVKLSTNFDKPVAITKLLITEADSTAESGIIFKAIDGSQIIVVAGAFPHTIAIQGVGDWPHVFEPEYPLENYIVPDPD
jgi:hypothetical protein